MTMKSPALLKMSLVAALLSLAVLHPLGTSAATQTPLGAAQRFFPGYQWRTPALTGDFKCDGKFGYALLGLAKTNTLVIVFLDGLDQPPEKIVMERDPNTDKPIALSTYSLDISDGDFREMLGAVPEGFRHSKRCKGLSLSDGDTDPYNFYWNGEAKAFWMWRL